MQNAQKSREFLRNCGQMNQAEISSKGSQPTPKEATPYLQKPPLYLIT
jgi:hypothetical protein